MAFGKPDFTDTVTEAEKVALRQRISSLGGMYCWPYKGPAGFNQKTVHRFCVDTKHSHVREWQKVRLSMKGQPTYLKLSILHRWWLKNTTAEEQTQQEALVQGTYVQVYNYLGALRRGGQLDENNRVRKWI